MKRYFPVQIEKGNSSYGAWFADFDGYVSAGRTIAEAIGGAHEALALHVAGMIEDGRTNSGTVRTKRSRKARSPIAMIGVTLPGKKKRVNVMIDEGLWPRSTRFPTTGRASWKKPRARKSPPDPRLRRSRPPHKNCGPRPCDWRASTDEHALDGVDLNPASFHHRHEIPAASKVDAGFRTGGK